MKAFIDSQNTLLTETINVSSDILEKCTMVANVFLTLSKYFDQLSELNSMVRNDRQTELFSWLSKTLDGSGHHIQTTGELVKLYCGSHLKYHLQEGETLKELYHTRENVK